MTPPMITPEAIEKMECLAKRVEALTGPDRDLDAEIAIELFDGGADHLDDPRDVTRARKVLISHGALPGNFEVVGFSGVSLRTAPAYTASLDAATSVLPPNTMYRSGHSATGRDPSMFFCDAVTGDGRDFHALAYTEAGARLACALRALSDAAK